MPSGTKNRCFCYNIAIAKDQSTGTFLYHVHRHGSTSMQLWSGMLGLIQVGSYSLKNSLDHELRNKIAQDIPFPIWGPSFRFEGTASRFKSKGNIDGSKSLKGSKTANVELNSWHNNGEAATIVPVLVGNEYVPTFQFKQGDVVRFRVVCIFVTMFCGFSIVDESNMDTRMKLYIIASDGISLEGMRETNHIILSSAQRLDVLVQLKDAGRFKIISDGVFVFTEPMPNPDTVLAYISVSPRPRPIPEKNIMSWRFKQSQPEMPSTIVQRRTIRFETDDDDKFMMPNELPQINGKSYREIVINTDVIHGTSEEWILEAPNDIHTYHMHVVPFYIKSIMTDDTEMMNNPAIRKAIIDDQLNMWRDVVMIPPKGNATILVRFDGHHPDDYSAFTGKTVYHCHLEDDADMGMMQNINILPSK